MFYARDPSTDGAKSSNLVEARGEINDLTARNAPWNFSQLTLAIILIHYSIQPIGPERGLFWEPERRKQISPPQIGNVISLEYSLIDTALDN